MRQRRRECLDEDRDGRQGRFGKTTIAGTLARLLAQQTGKVLAIDGDTNPSLALVLGLSPSDAEAITYTRSAVRCSVETAEGGRRLELAVPEAELGSAT